MEEVLTIGSNIIGPVRRKIEGLCDDFLSIVEETEAQYALAGQIHGNAGIISKIN